MFASDAPGVKLGHQLADSAAMLMMTDTLAFNGIILADNTYVRRYFCLRSRTLGSIPACLSGD